MEDRAKLPELVGLEQILEFELIFLGFERGPGGDDLEADRIADDEQRRMLQRRRIAGELHHRLVEIAPALLIFPGEVAFLPDIRPAVAPAGDGGALLKGEVLALRVRLCRVGWSKSRHRSMKCSCAEARSVSAWSFHFRMKSCGVMAVASMIREPRGPAPVMPAPVAGVPPDGFAWMAGTSPAMTPENIMRRLAARHASSSAAFSSAKSSGSSLSNIISSLARDRMLEAERRGVQRLAAELLDGRAGLFGKLRRFGLEPRPVRRIADERMADMGEMHADLMSAARPRAGSGSARRRRNRRPSPNG